MTESEEVQRLERASVLLAQMALPYEEETSRKRSAMSLMRNEQFVDHLWRRNGRLPALALDQVVGLS